MMIIQKKRKDNNNSNNNFVPCTKVVDCVREMVVGMGWWWGMS